MALGAKNVGLNLKSSFSFVILHKLLTISDPPFLFFFSSGDVKTYIMFCGED